MVASTDGGQRLDSPSRSGSSKGKSKGKGKGKKGSKRSKGPNSPKNGVSSIKKGVNICPQWCA